MQKETRRNSAAGSAKPNPPRKLTRAEKKQIAEVIRQAKGDGKAHTAQQTIPYITMTRTGYARYRKRNTVNPLPLKILTISLHRQTTRPPFLKTGAIFSTTLTLPFRCNFLSSIKGRSGNRQRSYQHSRAGRRFHSIRTEYSDMLKNQLSKGNNGLVKAKYITFAIEADSLGAAKSRLARIERTC